MSYSYTYLKVSDLVIPPSVLLSDEDETVKLFRIDSVYNYVDGVKQENDIVGYHYSGLTANNKIIKVKILGEKIEKIEQLLNQQDEIIVKFLNLKVKFYTNSKGFVALSLSATGIEVIK